MTRLFVGVWPPDEVRERIERVPRPDLPDVRWVPAGNWHVTLRFLGDVDQADAVARLTVAHLPTAQATVAERLERFAGGHVVVRIGGLDDVAATVREAVATVPGVADDARPFVGHLTIGRPRSRGRRPRRGTRGSHVDLALPDGPATFTVEHVALVASELDHGGSQYTTVATFPCR